MDLRDLFVPESRLTPRAVINLIKYLPLGSAYSAELRGGPHFRGWDESRYIGVATVNALRSLQHLYLSVNSKNKPKPPEPFPLPDSKNKKRDAPGSFASIAKAHLAAAKKQ
ncbi:D site-binding protein [Nocardia sp. IFM 10818]